MQCPLLTKSNLTNAKDWETDCGLTPRMVRGNGHGVLINSDSGTGSRISGSCGHWRTLRCKLMLISLPMGTRSPLLLKLSARLGSLPLPLLSMLICQLVVVVAGSCWTGVLELVCSSLAGALSVGESSTSDQDITIVSSALTAAATLILSGSGMNS
jgi:hypothetical protein